MPALYYITFACTHTYLESKMKYHLAILALSLAPIITAQNSNYLMPLRLDPVLSGNFGEIRSGHLHSGLDFKTQGRTGFPVRAMADGYVSKIFVSYGSGYMLHVAYPNGYTAVYRHNEAFSPKIARYTRKYQYENEVDHCEINVPEGVLPVVRGEVIATSGNEGYSMGPHLHLDLYETATGDWVDPLPHLARKIPDGRAPKATSILLVEQPGRGVVAGEKRLGNPSVVHTPIECWGEIGVAIAANDYADGASNKLGVKRISLTVDQHEVYRSELDRFSRTENNQMHSMLVHGHLKSYREPGTLVRFLHTDENRGIIHIDEERDYHLRYQLSDESGNTSTYHLVLRGKQMPIPSPDRTGLRTLRWDRANDLSMLGMQFVLPRGVLACNEYVACGIESPENSVSPRYILSQEPVELSKSCELRIALRTVKDVPNPKQYYLAKHEDGKKKYAGNQYKNGFISASIRSLGTYALEIDTVPPSITPVGTKTRWQNQGILTFSLKDSQTPIVRYKGKIDGRFELFHLRRRTGHTACNLKECNLTRGTSHTLEITATDACGNTQVYQDTFVW